MATPSQPETSLHGWDATRTRPLSPGASNKRRPWAVHWPRQIGAPNGSWPAHCNARDCTRHVPLEHAGWDVPIESDPRLDEIDYGPWGGLSSAQIEALGDGQSLADWSTQALWPAAFGESQLAVAGRVQSLAHELAAEAAQACAPEPSPASGPASSSASSSASGPELSPSPGTPRPPACVLIVSSNGVMRYLLDLVTGELERRRQAGSFKVGTGRGGRLRCSAGEWQVSAWDSAPGALLGSPLRPTSGRERHDSL